MRRYLETLFRRKGIFVTPLIVTPVIAIALLAMAGERHEITSTLWVEPSPFFEQQAQGIGGQARAPNDREAQALSEWLATESFRRQVLRESGLGQLVANGSWPRPNGIQSISRGLGLDAVPGLSDALRAMGLAAPRTEIQATSVALRTIRESIEVTTEGNNLMLITYRGGDAGLGTRLVETVIEVYETWVTDRRAQIAEEALEIHSSRVERHEERVTAASERLTTFLAANPAPRRQNAEAEAERLRRSYALEQDLYEEALRNLSVLRMEADAAISGRSQGFQVIDPAQRPQDSGAGLRMVAMTLFLGLAIGAGLGAGGIAMITWADGTVRSARDVNGLMHASLEGEIPEAPGSSRGSPHMARLIARRYLGS